MIQINNKLRDRCYQIACAHGFHDKEYSDEHWKMLIITEISEAVEADRKNNRMSEKMQADFIYQTTKNEDDTTFQIYFENKIKYTLEDELADVVIRCLDFAGLRNFNVSSVYFGNDGKTLTESLFGAVEELIVPPKVLVRQYQIDRVISIMFDVADRLGIDLFWHIMQKMRYNELRPKMHGKKY